MRTFYSFEDFEDFEDIEDFEKFEDFKDFEDRPLSVVVEIETILKEDAIIIGNALFQGIY